MKKRFLGKTWTLAILVMALLMAQVFNSYAASQVNPIIMVSETTSNWPKIELIKAYNDFIYYYDGNKQLMGSLPDGSKSFLIDKGGDEFYKNGGTDFYRVDQNIYYLSADYNLIKANADGSNKQVIIKEVLSFNIDIVDGTRSIIAVVNPLIPQEDGSMLFGTSNGLICNLDGGIIQRIEHLLFTVPITNDKIDYWLEASVDNGEASTYNKYASASVINKKTGESTEIYSNSGSTNKKIWWEILDNKMYLYVQFNDYMGITINRYFIDKDLTVKKISDDWAMRENATTYGKYSYYLKTYKGIYPVLCRSNIDGSNEKQLTFQNTSGYTINNNRILFAKSDYDTKLRKSIDGIYSMSLDGTNIKKIHSLSNPYTSAKEKIKDAVYFYNDTKLVVIGEYIYFISERSIYDKALIDDVDPSFMYQALYRMKLNGTGLEPLMIVKSKFTNLSILDSNNKYIYVQTKEDRAMDEKGSNTDNGRFIYKINAVPISSPNTNKK